MLKLIGDEEKYYDEYLVGMILLKK